MEVCANVGHRYSTVKNTSETVPAAVCIVYVSNSIFVTTCLVPVILACGIDWNYLLRFDCYGQKRLEIGHSEAWHKQNLCSDITCVNILCATRNALTRSCNWLVPGSSDVDVIVHTLPSNWDITETATAICASVSAVSCRRRAVMSR